MIYSCCRSLIHYPKRLRTIFTVTQLIGYKCQLIGYHKFLSKIIQTVPYSTGMTLKHF